jgi:hypothetical protein
MPGVFQYGLIERPFYRRTGLIAFTVAGQNRSMDLSYRNSLAVYRVAQIGRS